MRGTHNYNNPTSFQPGIIPAYAGNTVGLNTPHVPFGDHPRVCGEHSTHTFSCGHNRGSSPRMRGTHESRPVPRIGSGIIPAYAGNTRHDHRYAPPIRDHPRVCGEHKRRVILAVRVGGSSPRMRGTQARWDKASTDAGIIPAYAGNTRCYEFD